jgi:adenylosuccinate synthase
MACLLAANSLSLSLSLSLCLSLLLSVCLSLPLWVYDILGVEYLDTAYRNGQRIMIEGANATMLDLDHGTYPYVTSSNASIGGAITGLGMPPNRLDAVIGIMKAYTTRVGSGPFPTELDNAIGEKMRAVGGEFGVTTGRARRCGWLDIVQMRYSQRINNFTVLNMTKLDVLSELDEIKLAVRYMYKGKELSSFPANIEVLSEVQVEYETFAGWKSDISKIRNISDLPAPALKYVKRVESLIGVPIGWVGVGAGREAMAM